MPKFLKLLFFIDLWERFSFYGMKTMLVLYLTSALQLEDRRAYTINALFNFCGYLIPLFGGILADRVLGSRLMLNIGGILIAMGHFSIFFNLWSEHFFYVGLALIAVGLGFFKGNTVNILDACYGDSPQRGHGFSIFFIGINLGSFLASILCGIVSQQWGWHLGFSLAGVGMIIGLSYFLMNQSCLLSYGNPVIPLNYKLIFSTSLGILLSIAAVYFLLQTQYAQVLVYANSCISLSMISGIIVLYLYTPKEYQKRFLVFLILLFFYMIFYITVAQADSVLYLLLERHVNREVLGYNIPSGVFGSIAPLSFIIFGSFFAKWIKFDNQNAMFRFTIAMSSIVVMYLWLWAALAWSEQEHISALYYIPAKAIFAIGCFLMFPLMSNYATLIAPKNWKGFLVGIVFLPSALGMFLEGRLSSFFFAVPKGAALELSHSIYQMGMLKMSCFNLFFVLILCALYPFLKRNTT